MDDIAGSKVIPLFERIPSSVRRNRTSQAGGRKVRGRTEEHFPIARLRKTALVVDDDRDTVELMWEILRHGYHVIAAFDGLEAIEAYLRWRQHIDLIVTGLVMPVMYGDKLAERVRRVDPDLPIIVVSGWYEGLEPLKERNDLVTMRKPFTVRDLEDAMENCLRK